MTQPNNAPPFNPPGIPSNATPGQRRRIQEQIDRARHHHDRLWVDTFSFIITVDTNTSFGVFRGTEVNIELRADGRPFSYNKTESFQGVIRSISVSGWTDDQKHVITGRGLQGLLNNPMGLPYTLTVTNAPDVTSTSISSLAIMKVRFGIVTAGSPTYFINAASGDVVDGSGRGVAVFDDFLGLNARIRAEQSFLDRSLRQAQTLIDAIPDPETTVDSVCDDASVTLLYSRYRRAGGTLSCEDWDEAGRPAGPPTNDPPTVALRLSKETAAGGESVPFTLNSRDPEGDTLTETISVTGGSVARFLGVYTRNWVMPAAQSTDRQYTLTASISDGVNPAVVRSATITVEAASSTGGTATNDPPTVSVAADRTELAEGQTATLTATAADDDGSIASYRWSRNGVRQAGQTGSTVTVTRATVGRWTCVVTDDDGATASASVTITRAVAPNQNPTVQLSAASRSVPPGLFIRITATASDPDNDPLTYAWFVGNARQMSTSSTFDLLNPTRISENENVSVRCEVSDGRGGTASSTIQMVRTAWPVETINQPPTGTLTVDDETVDGGDTVDITLVSSDPDGDTVTAMWSFTGGSLSGDNDDTTRTWTAPTASNDDVTYVIIVTLSDGTLNATVQTEVTVTGTGMVEQDPCEQEETITAYDEYLERGNSVYSTCAEWVEADRPLDDPQTTVTVPSPEVDEGVCSALTLEGQANTTGYLAYIRAYVAALGTLPSITCEQWVAVGKPASPSVLGAATNTRSYFDLEIDNSEDDIVAITSVQITDRTTFMVTRSIAGFDYTILDENTVRVFVEWDPVGTFAGGFDGDPSPYLYFYDVVVTVHRRDNEKIRSFRVPSSIAFAGPREQCFPEWVPGSSDEAAISVLDQQESYVRRFSAAPEIITLPLYWHHPQQPDDSSLKLASDVRPGLVYDIHIPSQEASRDLNVRALCISTNYLGDLPGSDMKLAYFLKLADIRRTVRRRALTVDMRQLQIDNRPLEVVQR